MLSPGFLKILQSAEEIQLNDPHVSELHYHIAPDPTVTYDSPPPLDHETDAFRMHLDNGVVVFEMKHHHSSEESARAEVEKDIRAWEIKTTLERSRPELRLAFDKAVVIDRAPTPGSSAVVIAVGVSMTATLSLHF